MKKIIFYFSVLCLLFTPLIGKEDHRVEHQPAVIEQVAELPCQGVLKQKENGFVYLDVDNAFIKEVTPVLEMPGLFRPLPTAARSLGAHISVFTENEAIIPQEIGKSFSFEIIELRSFTSHTRDGSKKLWVLAVNAPELEALRERYGCAPRLQGHDFHITLGKQVPQPPEGWREVENFSEFDLSNEPTLGLNDVGDFVIVEELSETGVGQLCMKGNGYVFLDVSQSYPEIDKAHISVIHEDEMIGKEIWELEEVGEWFTFEVKQLRHVEKQDIWLYACEAPGLERLRVAYGLKPKLQGHDFHITLPSVEAAVGFCP